MNASDLDPWLNVLLLLAGLLLLLAVLRAWQVAAAPHPELVRKLFHLGGGLLALPLPWLFSRPEPVLALSVLILLVLGLMRVVPALKSGPGQVLAAVQRNTLGEFCFVLSLSALFLWARDRVVLYGVPLLVLTVADTFAALVGSAYGRHFYAIKGGGKSLEGSLAFFVAAFFCVHVPVLLLTDTPRLESLLIGLNIALMVTMAEAAAWWGLDNLIIPLFSYFLLSTFLQIGAVELAQHLAYLTVLFLLIRLLRRFTNLADDGLFGLSLWCYVTWSIADWRWVVPALILLGVYGSITTDATMPEEKRPFNFPVALANLFGSLVWLLIYRHSGEPAIFVPFAAVYGADLAIITLVRNRRVLPRVPRWRSIAGSTIKGSAILVPAIALFEGLNTGAFASMAAASVSVLAATVLFALTQRGSEQRPMSDERWLRQAACAAAGSVLSIAPALLFGPEVRA